MASAAAPDEAAASQSQRARPAVVSGHDRGPPVSAECTVTSSSGGASDTPPPSSVASPARTRRTTTHPAPADSDSDSSSNASAAAEPPALPPPAGLNEGRHQQVAVLALLGYNVTVLIGIIPELGRIVSDFSAAARAAYGVLAMAAAALLPVSFMAAVTGHSAASALCAKLGAVACSDLLLVAVSTRFGRWGRLAAAPAAAAVTCAMAALWVNGGGRARAAAVSGLWARVVRLCLRTPEPAGGDDDDVADESTTDIAGTDDQHVNDGSPTALLSGEA